MDPGAERDGAGRGQGQWRAGLPSADGRCLRFSRVPVPGGRRLRLHRKHAAPARSECRVVHVSAALPAEGAGPGERQRAGWAQWSATVAIYPGGCS